jgi:hypothetical protein
MNRAALAALRAREFRKVKPLLERRTTEQRLTEPIMVRVRFTDADLDTAIREGWDEGAFPLGSDSRPRPLTRSLPLATLQFACEATLNLAKQPEILSLMRRAQFMKIVQAFVKQIGGTLHCAPGVDGRGTRVAVAFESQP